MPAERLLEVPALVTGNLTGENLGELSSSIAVQKTAGDFANECRKQCASCKHFDAPAWQRLKAKWECSKEGVQQLNQMRAGIMEVGLSKVKELHQAPDGDIDLEHALAFLGVCHPLTEIHNDPVIVHPMSGCPDGLDLWEAANTDADKISASAFDQIMHAAEGKGP